MTHFGVRNDLVVRETPDGVAHHLVFFGEPMGHVLLLEESLKARRGVRSRTNRQALDELARTAFGRVLRERARPRLQLLLGG